MTPTSLESMLPEMQNIIAEYIIPLKNSSTPLFRFGICLRACNSSYRKSLSVIIKREFKKSDKIINFKDRMLTEELVSTLFRADHGIFQDIEHIDLSRAHFTNDLLPVLPSTLKTLRLAEVRFAAFDEIKYISHLVNLTSLSVVGCKFDDCTFRQALAQLPSSENMANPNLGNENIVGDVMTELVKFERFSKLICLDLCKNSLSDKGALQFVRSPYVANLTSLVLSRNNIGDVSMPHFAQSAYLGNLTKLILDYNDQIGDESIMELARSTYLGRLTKLGLNKTGVTAYGLMSILRSEYLTSLTTLEASCNDLGDRYQANHSGKPQHLFISRVTSLDLSYTSKTFGVMSVLMNSPLMANLNSLSLSCCYVVLSDVETLARSPYVHNITTLNLSGNFATDDWLGVLAKSSNFSKVISLDLSKNKICDERLRILSQSANLSSLTYLDLSSNLIGDRDARTLANSEFVGQLKRLKRLNLSRNNIEDDGLEALRRSKLTNGFRKYGDLDWQCGMKSPHRASMACMS